ncbi:uncharacterized protein LOC34624172 [Cyclospora cayetanensis]|uniref:Uncharacterized protein LOC34624172 n=1 Tax=Cyclospora cayetanensis TaxID=88456 RepID=A0A6P6RTF4_9EIME|nr:uncharacterized protein LOC34624172 [Cyclospora cayetanensis]
MPRGGHRGGIYPISGLNWGPGQRYLKRGLYRHQRKDIFVPRWGWRRENFNPSPLPDGNTKKWEPESSKAWPLLGTRHHAKLYAFNEARYLQPALRCVYTPAVEHILNILEPSAESGRCFSGIGRPGVRAPGTDSPSSVGGYPCLPPHLVKVAKDVEREGATSGGSVSLARLPYFEKGRIRRLWSVAVEADTWRAPTAAPGASSDAAGSGGGALPLVDERAAVVRELPLAECLYARSNHRLNSRRHPIWLHLRHQKDKAKIPYLHRRRVTREQLHADTIGALNA